MNNNERLKQLAQEAQVIAKDMAASLKAFGRNTAMLLYAKQLQQTAIRSFFTGDKANRSMSNEEANRKLNRTIEEAAIKWHHASEEDKQQVTAMEKIISTGQERIKHLYEPISERR